MKQAEVTIRLGAERNAVVVDGRTFDRRQLDREQNRRLTRLIRIAFEREQVDVR